MMSRGIPADSEGLDSLKTYTPESDPRAAFSCCGDGDRVPASYSHPRISAGFLDAELYGPHQ